MTISARATASITPKRKSGEVCETCKQTIPHPRNRERHALFFALLEPTMAQWPEAHPFQPMSTEHLRGWLLCEAGWCTVRDLTIGGPSKQHAANSIRYFLDDGDGNRFFAMTKTGIREKRPKSIAFKHCKEDDFRRTLDTICEIITVTIGVTPEQLKRETAA